MKLKKFWSVGRGEAPGAPLNLPLLYQSHSRRFWSEGFDGKLDVSRPSKLKNIWSCGAVTFKLNVGWRHGASERGQGKRWGMGAGGAC